MIGQDTDRENSHIWELLLRSGEPLENGFVDFAVRPEKEPSLMAAGGYQVELTRFVASR